MTFFQKARENSRETDSHGFLTVFNAIRGNYAPRIIRALAKTPSPDIIEL